MTMTKWTACCRMTITQFLLSTFIASTQIRDSVSFIQVYCQARLQRRQVGSPIHVAASDDTTSTASGCPFERAFPRNRIDLQNIRKKKNGLLSKVKPPFMLRKWQSAAQLQLLKSKYPDSHIAVHLGLDGAHATAVLWQSAAELLTMSEVSLSSSSCVIALEDDRLAQNFCHILEWGLTHVPDLREFRTVLHVEYLADDKAVRLVHQASRDVMRDWSIRNPSLDSARINQHTQAWVKRVLVKMGICPFTKSTQTSGQGLADVGVPVGKIAYHASSADNAIVLLADTWKAVVEFLDAGPESQSSILLAAPTYDDDFATWAGPIFCLLETTVVAAQAEADIGVVCFHPSYATPDGTTWPGFGHMHSVPRLVQWVRQEREQCQNETEEGPSPLSRVDVAAGGAWQRRTPHSTINVLRADQLARAEGRRDSASLYPRNIRALLAVGNERLQTELEKEQAL